MIAVKRWVLEKLLADKKWRKRLDKARNMTEAEKVIIAFCRAVGVELHHDIVMGRLVQA